MSGDIESSPSLDPKTPKLPTNINIWRSIAYITLAIGLLVQDEGSCLLAVLLGLVQLATSSPARFPLVNRDAAAASSSSSAAAQPTSSSNAGSFIQQTSAYTASSAFPTSLFASYYNTPASMTAEPRPVVTDVQRNSVFPETLLTLPYFQLVRCLQKPYILFHRHRFADIASQIRSELVGIFASSNSATTAQNARLHSRLRRNSLGNRLRMSGNAG